jgi:hypothetical protein
MPCVYLPGPAPAVTVANIRHLCQISTTSAVSYDTSQGAACVNIMRNLAGRHLYQYLVHYICNVQRHLLCRYSDKYFSNSIKNHLWRLLHSNIASLSMYSDNYLINATCANILGNIAVMGVQFSCAISHLHRNRSELFLRDLVSISLIRF